MGYLSLAWILIPASGLARHPLLVLALGTLPALVVWFSLRHAASVLRWTMTLLAFVIWLYLSALAAGVFEFRQFQACMSLHRDVGLIMRSREAHKLARIAALTAARPYCKEVDAEILRSVEHMDMDVTLSRGDLAALRVILHRQPGSRDPCGPHSHVAAAIALREHGPRALVTALDGWEAAGRPACWPIQFYLARLGAWCSGVERDRCVAQLPRERLEKLTSHAAVDSLAQALIQTVWRDTGSVLSAR